MIAIPTSGHRTIPVIMGVGLRVVESVRRPYYQGEAGLYIPQSAVVLETVFCFLGTKDLGSVRRALPRENY